MLDYSFTTMKTPGYGSKKADNYTKKVQKEKHKENIVSKPTDEFGNLIVPKGTDTGTNTQTQYEMWFDPSFNTITVDGFDQTNSFPMGLFYPVQLTPDNIDPNNLITLDVTDPYPWAITVYADATTLVKGDTAGGQYPYLWAPDVQGGN